MLIALTKNTMREEEERKREGLVGDGRESANGKASRDEEKRAS